jgi:Tol biopolymer transport system component
MRIETGMTRMRARFWRWLVLPLALGLALLAGCSLDNANTNPGVNLGSGTLLAFIGGDGNLWLAREDGSGAHAVTVTPCPNTVNCYGPPAWSPDGQSVAVFGPQTSNPSQYSIYIFNRQGLLQTTVAPLNSLAFGALYWSKDGKELAYFGSLTSLTPTKNAQPQYALIMLDAHSGAQMGALKLPAPTGSSAACGDNPRGGPLGSAVDRAISGSNGFRATQGWSSNGTSVLFGGGNCGTQSALETGSGAMSLLPAISGASDANVVQAAFSPDGQHIVATQTTGTEDDLVIYDATGANGKSILTDTSTQPVYVSRISAPTWSADGKTIYFMRGTDLWTIGADGSNAHVLLAAPAATTTTMTVEADPIAAPDGKALTWEEISLTTADAMPRTVLYAGSSAATSGKVVDDGAIWPAWS